MKNTVNNFIDTLNALGSITNQVNKFPVFIDTGVLKSSQWLTSLEELRPKINGTATPWIINTDLNYNTTEDYLNSYYVTEKFEDKYGFSSKHAYEKWTTGKSNSRDLSDWISAYLMIWDKIKDEDSKSNQSG